MTIEADTRTDDAILEITEAAFDKVMEIRAAEDDAAELGLRVEITGVRGVDFAYDLAFEAIAEAADTDVVYTQGELTIMVPAETVENLKGSKLDLPSNPMQGGLVIRNPNRPDPLAGQPDVELTGDVADRVQQLLEARINPGLAAHGGYATFVGVDGDTVYLTMGGGCQGCSMSAMTLTEGIRKAILEAIPEVSDVVDATDHSAGENPFFS